MRKDQDRPRPRWLVTGTSGRVGRMLWRFWRGTPPGAELLRQSRRKDDPGALLWDPLHGLLPAEAGRIDCLIAYAGITPTRGDDLRLNAALAEATLAQAHAAGISRVLLSSSSAVYGAPADGLPLAEEAPLRPLGLYGESKQAMEALCAPWRERGLEICCLRIGNVAGADALLLHHQPGHTASVVLDRFADGTGPVRSYIGPASLARVTAALAAMPGPLPPVLNIGAPRPVAMAELAEAAGFHWQWQEAPKTAQQRITLDLSRLETLFPFDPAESDPRQMVDQWHRLRDPE